MTPANQAPGSHASPRDGPGGGASGAVAPGLRFGKAPSNIHVYIILGVVYSTTTPLVPLRRTVLTLR
jgi:hypothetical protein